MTAQEADTPHVPELSWSPSKREVYWLPDPTATNVWTLELVDESLPSDQLPADAVKLGDVEDAEAAAEKLRDYLVGANKTIERRGRERDKARRERDALRDEVVGAWCALTEGERDEIDFVAPGLTRVLERLTGDVNRAAILDREPSREESKGGEPCPGDPKPAATELPPVPRDRRFQFDPLRIGVNNLPPVDQRDDQAGQ